MQLPSENKVIGRGGTDLERVYLYDCSIDAPQGKMEVKKSDYAGVDMEDVIARHLGRYGLVIPYLKPGFKILDFPCGSGLALEIFGELARFFKFSYEGWEFDEPTLLYARQIYSRWPWASFRLGDLTNFTLEPETYDTICCIEGIEHITAPAQEKACAEFVKGLKPGGALIISSPSPASGVSGPNRQNPYHLWELNREDFLKLLQKNFGQDNVEILSQINTLSTGERLPIFFAVCRKT